MDTVVMVIDANDHAPRFDERQYTFDVQEDVGVGALIGTVSATDDDEGDNALITYSFSRRTQVRHSTQHFLIFFQCVIKAAFFTRNQTPVGEQWRHATNQST